MYKLEEFSQWLFSLGLFDEKEDRTYGKWTHDFIYLEIPTVGPLGVRESSL